MKLADLGRFHVWYLLEPVTTFDWVTLFFI